MKTFQKNNEIEMIKKQTAEKVKIRKLINFKVKSTNKVKVSIIVPVCNVEKYLKECLDSIINQTLKEIEIICVNDGSSDNSESILEEYANKDKRVKVIDKENAGYGHAMNLGMDMASGEFIGIVESDDYVDIHMYETLYKAAVENKVDYVKCDFNRFIDIDTGREFTYMRSAEKNYYNRVLDVKKEKRIFKFNVQTWTGLYNRNFIINNLIRHNETPGASFQDNGFYYKTFCNAQRIMFIDKPYYFYRFDNPNSSIHNKGKVDAVIKEFDYILEYAKKCNLEEDYFQLYYWKKYRSYLYTLERIAEELKKDFFDYFSKDLKDMVETGKIKKEVFSANEWDNINWIIEKPENYYNIRVKQQKVTVIVPVYNVEKYVEQCLDSIVSQTLKEIEVICINDGSTDKSLSKLLNYQKKDKRICVYNQLNIGVGATRNRGIDMAHGEFVIFMDPDDFYPTPDVLETLYKYAKKYNVKISGGSFSDYINGEIKADYKGTLVDYLFKEDKVYNYKDYQFDYGFHRFIYNTQMLRDNKIYFPKLKRFQDPPFFVHAMLCAEQFYGMKKTVYCYRRNSNAQNISKEKLIDALNGCLDNLETSRRLGYKKLHSISAQRLFLTFVKPIAKYFDIKDQEFVDILININKAIDVNLIDKKICNRANTDYIWLIIAEEMRKELDVNNSSNQNSANQTKNFTVDDNYLSNQSKLLKLYGDKHKIEEEILKLKRNLLDYYSTDKSSKASKNTDTDVEKSISYKIGRFITWLPRKIRGFFKCWKENGFKYTMKRLFLGKKRMNKYNW